jgi:small GTP-binding protein
LVGDGRVGKTSIINKYLYNTFNENEPMTINSCFLEKKMIINEKTFKFALWDTAGQEKFNSVTPVYYRDAKGVILVYDITNARSFERVQKWIEEVRSYNKECEIVICGNKVDIKETYEDGVDKDKAKEYVVNKGIEHFYTSAKTGEGLEEVFDYVAKKVVDNYERDNKGKSGNGFNKSKKVIINRDSSNNESNKGNNGWCC